uniref:Type III-B CRISPR module-associated protein Cmr3 n=1 Tax=candidate division WOR-3 bacterium TaxID=2052148 RepID=A0A7C4WAB0_UNCW3
MVKFSITPFDVLFFGRGKPFNLSVQEASSIFPPLPTTLAGAISAKIEQEKGKDASKIIKTFYGPFLEIEEKILFPKPLDILSEKKKEGGEITGVELLEERNFKLIKPFYSDLKEELKSLLWERKRNKEFEVFEGFISLEGLRKWLNNQEVNREDLFSLKDVFDFEHRIGIHMDYSKNVTREEDALYRIDFVRLKKGVKIVFFVEYDVDNYNIFRTEDEVYDFFENNNVKVLKLGGEMRNVTYKCEKGDDIIKYFIKPMVENGEKIKILYLTQGVSEEEESYERISGVVKVANLGRRTKQYGKGLMKGIKEGSIIYAKVKDKDKLEKDIWLKPDNGEFIGFNLRIYAKI